MSPVAVLLNQALPLLSLLVDMLSGSTSPFVLPLCLPLPALLGLRSGMLSLHLLSSGIERVAETVAGSAFHVPLARCFVELAAP
jgi:hypothetical protein